MQRTKVESRALVSVGYDGESETLEIEFSNGRVFQYSGVAQSTYEWLLRAPNKGGLFNRLIRDHFPEVDVTPIVEQNLLEALQSSLAERKED